MVWGLMGHALSPVLSGLSTIKAIKYKPMPVVLPTGHKPLPATSLADCEAALKSLDKQAWVATSIEDRVKLLDQCMWRLVKSSKRIGELSVQAKGSYGQGSGEEELTMFLVILALKEYILSLKAGGARKPMSLKKAPGTDQLVAEVFPWGMLAALMTGYSGQVWIESGKPASQGAIYRAKKEGKQSKGGISIVLGAGNQYTVALLDVFHKLIAEDEVCCVKMSPVNEYLGPIFEEALAPLIQHKALAFAYGGKEVGEFLVNHPLVDSVHLTGSKDTFNAIVWGSPTAPRDGKPKLQKHITAELGNVTPVVVVPGPWTQKDIEFHARNIVAGMTQNASHNCCAVEVLVTAADWPQRAAFMAAIRNEVAIQTHRVAYYPGSDAKYDKFKQRWEATGKQVHELGAACAPSAQNPGGFKPKPWLLVEGLKPDEAALQEENWCGVMQEVTLPGTGTDAAAFMQAATDFCNNKVWGSLAASVWIHPHTQKQCQEAWNRFLASMRYGNICVNVPPTMGYAVTATPWGGAPGNTLQDIESGTGMVHNTFLFDYAVKGVVQAPWKPVPKPLHFPDNYAVPKMMPLLLRTVALLDKPHIAMAYMMALTTIVVRG